MDPRPSFLHRLYTFFFPHAHNEYRPHVFRVASVTALVIGVLILEGGYLAETKFVFPHTDFLASVLPGALVALTNDDRAANSAPAVTEDAILDQAATLAAQDMATKSYFAHVSPEGKTPWDWLNQVGYNYSYAGENLAVNFTDSSDVEHAWMASPSHHANIVKAEYTKVGIGVANGQYQGKDATFVVQFFATPATAVASPVVVAKEPSSIPSPATTSVATISSSTDVLGVAVTPVTPIATPTFFGRIASSPNHLIISILSVLAVIVFMLLLAAISVEVRLQYLEIIGGGLVLLIVIISALIFNASTVRSLQIPEQSEATVATQ